MHTSQRPNFLLIMADEERYPPIYETPAIRSWRATHLLAYDFLRRHGLEFKRHYAGSTACSPSRATIFTGQYPSLHGVSQTTGVAKSPYDPDMFWLDPNTVPTLGDYLRTAGYRTFYKGKWHFSAADILIPGTHESLPSYDPANGVPDPANAARYLASGRLDPYGFSGWVGPEPHGSDPRNSGSSACVGLSGRDVVFAGEAVALIEELASASRTESVPWCMVVSFVNPHDIALYGVLSQLGTGFCFPVEPTIPEVPPPPTFRQEFAGRPRCQLSYRLTYGEAFQPLVETDRYRRLYYQLQYNADQQIVRVLAAIEKSDLYRDTIVIFTSDHGELLGAHGGMTQKWYCAFEEAIHVPLIIHNPSLFPAPRDVEMLTSHVDLVPTILGMAGVEAGEAQGRLSPNHTEVHPLVGRNLSPLILGTGEPERAREPIYFMTDDDVTQGLDQNNFIGWPYNSVIQPNHVETVLASLPSDRGAQIWKYSRYFDNPQFWSSPGAVDDVQPEIGPKLRVWAGIKGSVCLTVPKTQPVPDEYELYNLTADPLEECNLADPRHTTPQAEAVRAEMAVLLAEQCRRKRLYPSSGAVPGQPACLGGDN